MMRPVRLYLAGPAGSGKTTVAETLVRDYGFVRVSLGCLCREEARRRGLPEDRATLQAMGDALRGPEPARLAILAWEHARRVPGPVVIDGVRLRAEAEWLMARGVVGVRLSAAKDVREARLLQRDGDAVVAPHATESEADILPSDLCLHMSEDRAEVCRATRLLVARVHLLAAVTPSPIGASTTTAGAGLWSRGNQTATRMVISVSKIAPQKFQGFSIESPASSPSRSPSSTHAHG